MTEDEKVVLVIERLIEKTKALTEEMIQETQTEREEPGMRGIAVFLLMFKAKEISEPLEQLHKLLNIKPEYHDEYDNKLRNNG